MTEIYLYIDARMAYYIHTHPYVPANRPTVSSVMRSTTLYDVVILRVRVKLIGQFKTCTTDIYLPIVARMAD